MSNEMSFFLWMIILTLLLTTVTAHSHSHSHSHSHHDKRFTFSRSYYPDHIPLFPVRQYTTADPSHSHSHSHATTTTTSVPLTKGNYRHKWSVNGHQLPSNLFDINVTSPIPIEKRVSLFEFEKIMQCSQDGESGLNQHGSFSMLDMISPTKETVEMFCVYEETDCFPWKKCREMAQQYKSGELSYSLHHFPLPFHGYYLLRVMNGSLYIDWPWGRHRLYNKKYTKYKHGEAYHWYQLLMTLEMIQDIPDSVFFYGAEMPGKQPWTHPFPNVAFNPTRLHNLIPFPWSKEFWFIFRLYRKLIEQYPEQTQHDIPDSLVD